MGYISTDQTLNLLYKNYHFKFHGLIRRLFLIKKSSMIMHFHHHDILIDFILCS
jgi:hypothetical protein